MRLAPKPPTTPKDNMRIGTLGLKMDRENAAEKIILPDMQTFCKPNLFIRPPTIGPHINFTPTNSDPTHDTVVALES